jgi:hypothetical protein
MVSLYISPSTKFHMPQSRHIYHTTKVQGNVLMSSSEPEPSATTKSSSDPGSSSRASALEGSVFGASDAEWLRKHQHRKILDARVRIIGVAARDAADGHPTVLVCYPLRDVSQTSAAAGTHEERRERRGGSKRKWAADEPVPWPNYYWLACPTLVQRVGRLEHLGLIQKWQAEVHGDEHLASQLSTAHRDYGRKRWGALSEEDREYCLQRPYAAALRDTGVAGMKVLVQIKCLHAHLAHALADGQNPIGRRVMDALERNLDSAAGLSQTR